MDTFLTQLNGKQLALVSAYWRVVPAGLNAGPISFQIGNVSGAATLSAVAPGLFSANNTGRGPAAAFVSRPDADGTSELDPTVTCTGAAGACSNTPIDLPSATGQIALELFGTGIRGRASVSDVRVSVGGVLVTPSFAGPQSQYSGMDSNRGRGSGGYRWL